VVVAVELRASGPRGSIRGTPAKKLRGSGRPENHWRRGIAAAQRLTGGDVRGKSGAMVAETEGSELGGSSWRHGGVVAGSCGVGGAAVWRGRGGAEGSARRSEQSGMEAALGFVGRRSVGLGEGAEDWGGLKEAGRGSRRGSKEGNPGELGGIQARALRCGGEEAGRRARAAARGEGRWLAGVWA